MTTMVEPWYHGWFCSGTPILVNLDNLPEVDEWLSKSGSRINRPNRLFTYAPYEYRRGRILQKSAGIVC